MHPNTSSSEPVVCLKLEELILALHTNREVFDIKDLINMVTTRAFRGSMLRIVRIVGGEGKLDPGDMLELRKHVLHVECGPKWA